MSVWEDLLEYLSSNRDLSLGLTAGKMLGRAYDIKETDDCITFKMERHRGVLGSMYTPGSGMSAYKTRIEEYKYCTTSRELESWVIEELPFDPSCIDYGGLAEDHFSLFSFSIEEDDDGNLKLTESCCNDEWPIESLEDAIAKASEVIDRVDYEMLDPVDELEFTEEEKIKFIANFKEAAHLVLESLLTDQWNYGNF